MVAPADLDRRRIFLVEDHPLYRRGLRELLSHEPDLEVCGEAASAKEAIGALRVLEAELVIVDISLPGANGMELIKNLRAEHPNMKILVVSAHPESVYARRALRAGAGGYVSKLDGCEELLAAVRKVLEGKVAVSRALSEQFIIEAATGRTNSGTPVDMVSDRELEVLELIGAGHSTATIANILRLGAKTVESHRLHLKTKLGLADAPALVCFAVDWVRGGGDSAAG